MQIWLCRYTNWDALIGLHFSLIMIRGGPTCVHESLQVQYIWPGRYHVTAMTSMHWTSSDPCTHVRPPLKHTSLKHTSLTCAYCMTSELQISIHVVCHVPPFIFFLSFFLSFFPLSYRTCRLETILFTLYTSPSTSPPPPVTMNIIPPTQRGVRSPLDWPVMDHMTTIGTRVCIMWHYVSPVCVCVWVGDFYWYGPCDAFGANGEMCSYLIIIIIMTVY